VKTLIVVGLANKNETNTYLLTNLMQEKVDMLINKSSDKATP